MSLPVTSRVLSAAARTPDRIVTNDELAAVMDTNDEWIQKRSGIKQRRYVDNGGGSVALAEAAAREALEKAGLTPADIGLILCATLSPDVAMPGNSALLSERLGLAGVPAFDVYNQCSGFLYSLVTADRYIRTGGAKHVLVVGSEVHSTGLEYTDRGRHVTVLFGDAAGVALVGPSDDAERGLLAANLHAEGAYAEKLCCMGPGTRNKPYLKPEDVPEAPYVFPHMEGQLVFRHAVTRMTECVKDAVESIGKSVDDIDMLLPHQANLRINQLVAMGLGIGDDRMANNIERYGNTTAATIPLLLTETLAADRIHEGDLVCMAAFGAGFTWGSALLRW